MSLWDRACPRSRPAGWLYGDEIHAASAGHRRAAGLAACGGDRRLTRAEFTVLVTLGQHAVLSPSSIGALANLDKVKVSRVTAGLTARGLVRHSCDPSDQRVCRLRLTRQGSAYRRTLPALRAVEASLTGQVSQREWRTFDRAGAAAGPCRGSGPCAGLRHATASGLPPGCRVPPGPGRGPLMIRRAEAGLATHAQSSERSNPALRRRGPGVARVRACEA
jgi:DNA-binding MarR family transcriptional regulator